MKNRILSLFLAVLLVMSAFAFTAAAEEAAATGISLTDATLRIGDKSYAFPISVADLRAMGVNVADVSSLTEGYYYYDVKADNGRDGFSLRVDYLTSTEDPFWVTGVNLNSNEHAGMSVGGMTLGETTLEEIVSACGADVNGDTYAEDLYYTAFNRNYSWWLYFDGSDKSSKLTKVSMSCDLVTNYGVIDASQAGVQTADLPAATDLAFNEFILDGKLYAHGMAVQNLLDNGWYMPQGHDADGMIEAKDGSRASGDRFAMYNGVSLVTVSAYNFTDAECMLADCVVDSVSADIANDAALLCADGLQNGVSTYDDAVAILGEPVSVTEGKNGLKTVRFTVINSVTYEIGVLENGLISSITISGLR